VKLRSYKFLCRTEECGYSDTILFDLDVEDSDAILECPECGEATYSKTLYISSQGANTSKTSETIPAGVRKFEGKRAQRKIENAIRRAKKTGDTDTIIEASKESLDRGIIAKGVPNTPTTRRVAKNNRKD
jgi:hypothetical protein